MRRRRFQNRGVARRQSVIAILLLMLAAGSMMAPTQAVVLHGHGTRAPHAYHAHYATAAELNNWPAAHADQHATWLTKPGLAIPVAQDAAMELVNTNIHGITIAVGAAPALLHSSGSDPAPMSRSSPDLSTPGAGRPHDLQRPPPLPPPPLVATAPSLVAAILKTTHSLLV